MAMIELNANGYNFQAYLTEPNGPIKGGLIIIHEVWGLTEHIKGVADRFAAEGYVCVAPDLLSEQEILKHADQLQLDLFNPATRNEAQPKLRELMAPLHDDAFVTATIAKLKSSFNYLSARADVAEDIGVVGYCFGGTYAFQLAAEEPLIKAAVPFYGHAPLTEGKLKWITCPVQAFYGERDEGLMKQLPAVETAMHDADIDFEAKVYGDAGHAFFNDTNPFAYNEAAAQDSWTRTLTFLERTLANSPKDK